MFSLLSNFFRAIGSMFGWAALRNEQKNRADIVTGAEAAREQKEKDAVAAAIGKKDLETLRKDLAE